MGEVGETPKPEKSSTLADRLFSKAFTQNAQEHLEKAKQDMARGATEQVNEHLKRTIMALAQPLTHMTSPRLSEQENEEWLELQQRKYRVQENGMIWEKDLGKDTEARLRSLGKKAFGQE